MAFFQAQAISYKDLSISINQLIDDAGKKTDGLSIPDELCQLGVSLLGNQVGSVYCPYSNGNDFAIHFMNTVLCVWVKQYFARQMCP